jgi:hypothetical protein
MADGKCVGGDGAQDFDGSAMMIVNAPSKEQDDGWGLGVLQYEIGNMAQSPPALTPDAGSDN